MKKLITLLFLALISVGASYAQQNYPAMAFGEGTFLGETIPLRDFAAAQPTEYDIESVYVVPNNLRRPVKTNPNALPMGPDPLSQTTPPSRQPIGIIENFDGGLSSESGGVIPPDPSGAVGPDHYVHAFNLRVKIFDKSGTLLVGPVSLGSFLGSGNSDGDPIVMYDHLADRWFVSQFRVSDNALIIGVSTTPDPTGTYNVYEYPLSTFPDYPHYTVWPDGYYLTANKSGLSTYVFNRDDMLTGAATASFRGFGLTGIISNPNTVFSPEPANLVGTDYEFGMPGYIVYLHDDAWNGVSQDHLKVWTIHLDWNGTSSISAPQEIITAPFDTTFQPFGTGDIEQPGTTRKLDGQGGIISYMANYRKFDTHNSFVINFNTDIDGNDLVGIRWVELRNNGGDDPFTLYQEGTWTVADGDSRFMGTNCIDEDGNIGLLYNVGSSATRVGIRFTGRMESDPLGTMTFPETSVIESNGIQTWINRWGDYAQTTIDIDDRTMWSTSEYIPTTNTWRTRVAAYRLVDDYTNDVGVYVVSSPGFVGPYTASETVTVGVSNFGTAPQSNFDMELYVDGGLVATETYSGTLNPGEEDTFSFAATVDLSLEGHLYEVEARTLLSGDDYTNNDDVTKYYLFGELLGVSDSEINESDIFMYPVSDKLYELKYNTSEDLGNLSYRIYNVVGQEFTNGSMETESNGYRAGVNMNSAATGVYIIEVSNGQQKTSKRIMVY